MLNKILKISILKFIYFNFLSKRVKRDKGCYIIPYRGAIIEIGRNGIIELHGNFYVAKNKPYGSKREAYVLLRNSAKLLINGNTVLAYGATIELHKGAVIEIGSAYINVGAVILAADSIKIGKGALVSRDVYIYDADHHMILDEEGKQKNQPKPVNIEDHVWLGIKVTVLRGSRIGEGAVVAAGSTVSGKVKAGTIAIGYPARSFSNVIWSE